MKAGDLVYWYCPVHKPKDCLIGLIVNTYDDRCSVYALLSEGLIYHVPRYQIKKEKHEIG